MLERGFTPENILEELLGGLAMEVTDRMPVQFACNCSKERILKALVSIPKSDIREMIDDNEPIEVKCQFCNTAYSFDVEELKEMLADDRTEKL